MILRRSLAAALLCLSAILPAGAGGENRSARQIVFPSETWRGPSTVPDALPGREALAAFLAGGSFRCPYGARPLTFTFRDGTVVMDFPEGRVVGWWQALDGAISIRTPGHVTWLRNNRSRTFPAGSAGNDLVLAGVRCPRG